MKIELRWVWGQLWVAQHIHHFTNDVPARSETNDRDSPTLERTNKRVVYEGEQGEKSDAEISGFSSRTHNKLTRSRVSLLFALLSLSLSLSSPRILILILIASTLLIRVRGHPVTSLVRQMHSIDQTLLCDSIINLIAAFGPRRAV